MPGWLKGAGLGILTYLVPFALYQIVELTDSLWSRFYLDAWWKTSLYALLLAAVEPLELLGVPTIVMHILVPLIWTVLGAVSSRILGFRRGCVVLLVLEAIVIGVLGFLHFALLGYATSM
jgi:hypothetical protein